MKKFLLTALLFIGILSTATSGSASDQSDRRGFRFQLSPKGVFPYDLSGSQDDTFDPFGYGFGLGLVPGYGVTDQLVILLDAGASVVWGADGFLFTHAVAKTEYFFGGSPLYLEGGVGFEMRRVSPSGDESWWQKGVIISTGVGYEWRSGEKFFVSPEFDLDFSLYSSGEGITPLIAPKLAVNVGWFF